MDQCRAYSAVMADRQAEWIVWADRCTGAAAGSGGLRRAAAGGGGGAVLPIDWTWWTASCTQEVVGFEGFACGKWRDARGRQSSGARRSYCV